MDTIKAGNMFETSWGYDQTNYEFIIVLEVSSTGKTAKCQRTSAERIGGDAVSDDLKPINKPFGDVFTMRIKTGYKGQLQLRGSYPFCHDGSMNHTRLGTFDHVESDRAYSETNSMFGH